MINFQHPEDRSVVIRMLAGAGLLSVAAVLVVVVPGIHLKAGTFKTLKATCLETKGCTAVRIHPTVTDELSVRMDVEFFLNKEAGAATKAALTGAAMERERTPGTVRVKFIGGQKQGGAR